MGDQSTIKVLREFRAAHEKSRQEQGAKLQTLYDRLEALEKAVLEKRIGEFIPGLGDEVKKRKPSWMQILRGVQFGEWGDGYEKAILEESHKKYESLTGKPPGVTKVMGIESDETGGYMVPPELMSELIERLKAEAVTFRAGARLINGLTSSPVWWPRLDGSVTTYWVGENTSITASDLDLGQIQMEPKRLAALVKLSQRLARMAVPAADAAIEEDMATELALALDIAILEGTGADGQPLGVKNQSGVGSSTLTAGEALTASRLLHDFIGVAQDANARVEDPSFAMISHPGVFRNLQSEQVGSGFAAADGDGAYAQGPPIMSLRQLSERMGIGLFGTTQIDNTVGGSSDGAAAYLGVWRDCIVGQWFGMTLESSTQSGDAFAKSQLWLKMELEVDVALRHAASFVTAADVHAGAPA